MKIGSKSQAALGVLELLLGMGLILYVCQADRQRIGLATAAVAAVTAGLVTFSAAVTAVPAKHGEERQ